jgi:hypothetical protein
LIKLAKHGQEPGSAECHAGMGVLEQEGVERAKGFVGGMRPVDERGRGCPTRARCAPLVGAGRALRR